MFLTAVGGVVKVERNISGSNLSVITIAAGYSGQTNDDGNWSKRSTGYFDFRVWENNMQAGLNTDFTNMMSKLKKGDQITVLADVTDIKTIKEGHVTDRRPVFTALRLSYASSRPATDASQTRLAVASEEEGFIDVPDDDEPYVDLDPFA